MGQSGSTSIHVKNIDFNGPSVACGIPARPVQMLPPPGVDGFSRSIRQTVFRIMTCNALLVATIVSVARYIVYPHETTIYATELYSPPCGTRELYEEHTMLVQSVARDTRRNRLSSCRCDVSTPAVCSLTKTGQHNRSDVFVYQNHHRTCTPSEMLVFSSVTPHCVGSKDVDTHVKCTHPVARTTE